MRYLPTGKCQEKEEDDLEEARSRLNKILILEGGCFCFAFI